LNLKPNHEKFSNGNGCFLLQPSAQCLGGRKSNFLLAH
jgi:hypothetical protein